MMAVDSHVVEEIRRLTEAGGTLQEIALSCRVTTRTVSRYRAKLGLAAPAPVFVATPEWHALVRPLVEQRYPTSEIARISGASVKAVKRWYPEAAWSRAELLEYARMLKKLKHLQWVH